MEKPTELEKRIWKILDEHGINPMLQPNCCDRILAVVNKLSENRVIEHLAYCDDDSYGYDEIGLCNDCGLERNPDILSKEKNIIFNEFCKEKKCSKYIEWECEGCCISCKLIGQSYNITEYPKDCLFLDDIKKFESENKI